MKVKERYYFANYTEVHGKNSWKSLVTKWEKGRVASSIADRAEFLLVTTACG
jgi:hypothetical protein